MRLLGEMVTAFRAFAVTYGLHFISSSENWPFRQGAYIFSRVYQPQMVPQVSFHFYSVGPNVSCQCFASVPFLSHCKFFVDLQIKIRAIHFILFQRPSSKKRKKKNNNIYKNQSKIHIKFITQQIWEENCNKNNTP